MTDKFYEIIQKVFESRFYPANRKVFKNKRKNYFGEMNHFSKMSYTVTKAWRYLTFRFGRELDLEDLQRLGNSICFFLNSANEHFDDVEEAVFWYEHYWETFKPVIDHNIHVFNVEGEELNFTPERDQQVLTEDQKKTSFQIYK